jgi:hypothetical protein
MKESSPVKQSTTVFHLNWIQNVLTVVDPLHTAQELRMLIERVKDMNLLSNCETVMKDKIEVFIDILLDVQHKQWPWETQPSVDWEIPDKKWHVRKYLKALENEKLFAQLLSSEIPKNIGLFTVLQGSVRSRQTGGVIIISTHSDTTKQQGQGSSGHIHIVHDCTKHHGQCRCSFLQSIRPVHHAKGKIWTREFDHSDLLRELLNLNQDGRKITDIYISGRRTRIPDTSTMLEELRHTERSSTGSVPARIRKYKYAGATGFQASQAYNADGNDSSRRGHGSWWNAVGKELELYNFLKDNFIVPLDSIVNTKVSLHSNFKFLRANDTGFKNVIDTIQSEFVHMSVLHIYQFWLRSPTKFRESEDYKSLGLETYNLNDSVTLCNDFLLFQFNQSDELVSDFLSTLYSVLDRKTCKKNCLEVISPPTSGKNWFFDPILLFMCSVGQIKNAKKRFQFPT